MANARELMLRSRCCLAIRRADAAFKISLHTAIGPADVKSFNARHSALVGSARASYIEPAPAAARLRCHSPLRLFRTTPTRDAALGFRRRHFSAQHHGGF